MAKNSFAYLMASPKERERMARATTVSSAPSPTSTKPHRV